MTGGGQLMTTTRILTVLGTRPELVKLAPVLPLLDAEPGFEQVLLHTGQHYSVEMDAIFFRELRLRQPDVALQVGSGSHAEQTAAILTGVERALQAAAPVAAALVLGDTNSTLGGALAAAKLGVPVVHVEAGCRSFVRDMPEEINRVLVDHLARHLLAPDAVARENLLREGLLEESIAVVGSTSIDAALRYAAPARARPVLAETLAALGLADAGRLLLCTVHRAENTTPEALPGLLRGLARLSEHYPIVFPMHPRTRHVLAQLRPPVALGRRIHVLPPLGYLDLLALLGSVRALLTDSGGLQEEAAALGTPALVLRGSTEWSYLIEAGKNALVGNDEHLLYERAMALLGDDANRRMRSAPCDLGGGGAAGRIVAELRRRL